MILSLLLQPPVIIVIAGEIMLWLVVVYSIFIRVLPVCVCGVFCASIENCMWLKPRALLYQTSRQNDNYSYRYTDDEHIRKLNALLMFFDF